MIVQEFTPRFEAVRREVAKAVAGQDDIIHAALVAMLARGHVLLEGVPGIGKTLLARTFAAAMGLHHRRIQFTPDLMPSDVTGSSVYREKTGTFEFVPGPVFTQLLLADEINRAPAKTQSALLEAMQEGQVTVDGETRALPRPFAVLATQNPVESQGTYPLPEAQLDRFLVKLVLDYPAAEAEQAILTAVLGGFDPAHLATAGVGAVVDESTVIAMQRVVDEVRVDPAVVNYVTELVRRTRQHRALAYGASPRASIALLRCAQIHAAADGRDFVTPDDVKQLALDVLRHRVVLHPDAELAGSTAHECIESVFRDTPAPRLGA